jgi:hypothetical protein
MSVNTTRIQNSLNKAFRGFFLDAEDYEVPGMTDWWDGILQGYASPMLDSVHEFIKTRYRVFGDSSGALESWRPGDHSPVGDLDMGGELYLSSMLETLDKMELLLAALPKSVNLLRNLSDTECPKAKRQPKTLRLWKKVNRVLDRPVPVQVSAHASEPESQKTEKSSWNSIVELHSQLAGMESGDLLDLANSELTI